MIPIVLALTLVLVSFVSASCLVDGNTQCSTDDVNDNIWVEFNGIEIIENESNDVAGFAGDNVPVEVRFIAGANSSDVKVELEIYGGRDDYEAESRRFNIVAGKQYKRMLNLELPSDLDDDLVDDLTLKVTIKDADNDDFIGQYTISMQRESYELQILSVDIDSSLSSGSVVPVTVVAKNTGFEEAEDAYVLVSIPELGVSARGYLGDLIPTEDCDSYYYDVDCDDEEEDAREKTVFLRMPDNVKPGVYEVVVKVYDRDSSTSVKELVSFGGSTSSNVLAGMTSKDMAAGETTTFDVIIVNPSDSLKVYELETISGTDLTVVAPSVVTVGPKSSKTVQVSVTAADDAEEGTQTFTVNANGEQVTLGVNITGDAVSNGVVALTVVLVVIFVVLLIVLIVLLTRRERPIEEVETSYY